MKTIPFRKPTLLQLVLNFMQSSKLKCGFSNNKEETIISDELLYFHEKSLQIICKIIEYINK